ncbi:hypothetical protein KKF38_01950, partial [Patescibacteria group bacterium]|nr:hypothetical protein [Patescibacteria group bacterium]
MTNFKKTIIGLVVLFGLAGVVSAVTFETGDCPTGMVSYWKFDEGSGTTAYDSYDSNDGTLINGPVWTTGKVGNALSFDGVDDYVDLGGTVLLKPDAFTFESWFNANSASSIGDRLIIEHNPSTNSDLSKYLWISNDYDGIVSKIRISYLTGSWYSQSKITTLSEWNHITVT